VLQSLFFSRLGRPDRWWQNGGNDLQKLSMDDNGNGDEVRLHTLTLTKQIKLDMNSPVYHLLLRSIRLEPHRLVGLLLLLAVFFLPLHVHSISAPAKVAKECTCLHGKRTDAVSAIVLPSCTPVLAAEPIATQFQHWSGYVFTLIRHIRAPPTRVSL
jgi:hypothetical protein